MPHNRGGYFLDKRPLTIKQERVLQLLRERGPHTTVEIEKALGIQGAAMALFSLELRGLARRQNLRGVMIGEALGSATWSARK